jgi:hypothetical protein
MTRRFVSLLLPMVLSLFAARFAQAQRGGGHGGVSAAHVGAGHFGMGSQAGTFSSSFSRAPLLSRSPSLAFGLAGLRSNYASAYSSYGRRPYQNRWNNGRYRGPYVYSYGAYPFPNVVGYPFGYGYGDGSFLDDADYGYDQESAYPTPSQQEPYAAPENYGPPPFSGPNEEPGDSSRPAYQDSGLSEPAPMQPATALIFQDGRPTEQVHNYVLTKTTLYDLDAGNHRDIPLADLNLPATIAANRSAGVDFSLPAGY